jgi:hypothetical protein
MAILIGKGAFLSFLGGYFRNTQGSAASFFL